MWMKTSEKPGAFASMWHGSTFVLEHYGKSKLTAKLADKFREDVANGKIKL